MGLELLIAALEDLDDLAWRQALHPALPYKGLGQDYEETSSPRAEECSQAITEKPRILVEGFIWILPEKSPKMELEDSRAILAED